MQFGKQIRYRARLLLVLALLAPCLGIISLDVASNTPNQNASEVVIPLLGVKYATISYDIDKRTVPQGAIFTVTPITPNVVLNEALKNFVKEKVTAFTSLAPQQLYPGFMPQITITPFLDYVSDDAFSVSMQLEEYKTNQDVSVHTVSWIADAKNVKQITLTKEIATELSSISPNLKASFTNTIDKNLAFGVLPNQSIRFYNDSEPFTNYTVDLNLPKSTHLGAIVDSYFYKQYPLQLTPLQKKSIKESYDKFLNKKSQHTNCTNSKCIALTFDDGPSPDISLRVLDILKKHQVKATFFELGIQVEKYPEIAKLILKEGHEIQNHSYNHPDFIKLKNAKAIKDQIDKTDELLRQIGTNPTMVRPPYGSYTIPMHAALKKPFVLWNVDAQEWRSSTTADNIIQLINARARQSAVVVMHDTREQTAAHLDGVITNLKQRGYKLVTMTEILGGSIQPNGKYYSGQ